MVALGANGTVLTEGDGVVLSWSETSPPPAERSTGNT
jgi:hypothetical protein